MTFAFDTGFHEFSERFILEFGVPRMSVVDDDLRICGVADPIFPNDLER